MLPALPGRRRARGDLQEEVEFRHQEAERHHRDFGTHPGEERPLVRRVVGEVADHPPPSRRARPSSERASLSLSMRPLPAVRVGKHSYFGRAAFGPHFCGFRAAAQAGQLVTSRRRVGNANR